MLDPGRKASLLAGLVLSLWVPLAGCGGDLVVEMETPLMVRETYPISGSEVAPEALRQIRVSFTHDLGDRAASSSPVREHILLSVSSDDGDSWEEIPVNAWAYERDEQTLVLTLAEETLDQLRPRWELRLRVLAGLETSDGTAVMVRDRAFFFRVGS